METKLFDHIELENGEATLPKIPPLRQQVSLDLAEFGDTLSLHKKAALFLDLLPDHIATVQAVFHRDYAETASFVPEWLFEEAPVSFAALFPNARVANDVSANDVWQALAVRSIWASDEPTLTIDFEFMDTDMNHVFAAYFDLEGKLLTFTMES